MSFGEGNLRERVGELEAENDNLRSQLENRNQELAAKVAEFHRLNARIEELETLVLDMHGFGADDWRYTPLMGAKHDDMRASVAERMAALGLLEGGE